MFKQLTLVVSFLAIAGGLQGCDEPQQQVDLGQFLDQPQGPFGIHMGMPLEELDRSTNSIQRMIGYLKSVPKPHPLIQRYKVTAEEYFGVCGIGFWTKNSTLEGQDRIFETLMSQLVEKYGKPSIEEGNGTDIFGEPDEMVSRITATWENTVIREYIDSNVDWGDVVFVRLERRSTGETKEIATEDLIVEGEYRFSNYEKCRDGSSEIL